MQLNEIIYTDAQPISGYGPDFFRVGEARIDGNVLVTAEAARSWGGYDDPESLLALAGQVDVLFVGTGGEIAHLPAAFREALEAAEIGVEAMSSPSAARTYNVLVAEGRRVAAALLMVGQGK